VALIAAFSSSAPGWIEAHLPNNRNPNLAVMTFLMGLFVLIIALGSWLLAARAALWPVVRGEIAFSGIKQRRDNVGTTTSRHNTTMHEPDLEYNYTVNGQNYIGRQLSGGGAHRCG
jgi:hypothetical protein